MRFEEFSNKNANKNIPQNIIIREYNRMKGYDLPLNTSALNVNGSGGGHNKDGINSVVDNYVSGDYVD